MDITVGIYTDGPARISRQSNCTILHNQLIGKDFHWQKSICSILPGEVVLSDNDEFGVINTLDLETYLESVIGSEMNPASPLEFLKAHAIISRSWAVGKILHLHPADSSAKIDLPDKIIGWDDTHDHHGVHVCSDDHCQRYQGVQKIDDKLLQAIRATAGMVLTDSSGGIVDARFSKCCGGKTEVFSTCWQPHEIPCLESIDDPWCDLSALPEAKRHAILRSILKDYDLSTAGGYSWEASVSSKEIADNLHQKFGRDIGEIADLQPLERGASGRIKTLLVIGRRGELTLGNELYIRRLLAPTHLYSSWFDFEHTPTGYRMRGHGWGHGVGLCQIGAAHMAVAGHSAEEILQFYYSGSTLTSLDEITAPE